MIKVDVQGVEQTIKVLDNLVSQARIDQFLNKLALIGTEEARTSYGSGASVWYVLGQNSATIYAGGDAIGFLEFGAGAATDPNNEFVSQVSYPVRKGSWSDAHGGEYSQTNYEYWHFGTVKFTAVQPKRGMYNAKQKILAEIHNIAKEIFK